MKNNLLEWATQQDLLHSRIAQDLGVHHTLISKIAHKHRKPSAEFRLRFLLKYGAAHYLAVFGPQEGAEAKISELLRVKHDGKTNAL